MSEMIAVPALRSAGVGLLISLTAPAFAQAAAEKSAAAMPISAGNAKLAIPVFAIGSLLVIAIIVLAWRQPRRRRPRASIARPAVKETPPPRLSLRGTPAPPRAGDAVDADAIADTKTASAERLRATPAPPAIEHTEEFGADFYDEVARLLHDELQKNPGRRDLRFKLMEVYASAEQREAFVEQTRHYLLVLGGQLDPYWPRIVRMGLELAPETGLYTEMPPLAPPSASLAARKQTGTQGRRYYDGVNQMTLNAAQAELQDAYKHLREDLDFWASVQLLCETQLAPPAPLQAAPALSGFLGGAQIYFKDERQRPHHDTAILSALGQVVIAQRMGKRRVVAGGLHDGHVRTVARAAQALGLECTVYLHESEQSDPAALTELQQRGAAIMSARDSILGAAAETQLQTLADSLDDAAGSFYVCPLAAGPMPYPTIVRDLQGLAGRSLRTQITARAGRLADAVLVSTADGMHAVGLLHPFLTTTIDLYCVESAQNLSRSSRERYSREHSWLRASERVQYSSLSPEVARFAAQFCLPEDWHEMHSAGGEVLAETFRIARTMSPEQILVAVIPADVDLQQRYQTAIAA